MDPAKGHHYTPPENAEAFDAKKHGVGTQPMAEPESLAKFWPMFKALLARVEALEQHPMIKEPDTSIEKFGDPT